MRFARKPNELFCDPDVDHRIRRAVDLQLTDPYESARAFEAIDADVVDLAPLIPFETGIRVAYHSEGVGNVQANAQLGGDPFADVDPVMWQTGRELSRRANDGNRTRRAHLGKVVRGRPRDL